MNVGSDGGAQPLGARPGPEGRRSEVVVRIARSLAAPGRLSEVLREPLITVCTVLDAAAASLFVPFVAEDREQLGVAFARSGGELQTTTLGMELGLHAHVLREGKPLMVADVRERPEYRGTLESAFEVQPRALLAVPLRRGGKVLGVVEVLREEPRPFEQDDLVFLETAAVEIAVAVERDLLHRQLRLDLQERELLLRITRKVGASLDLEEVLDHVLDALAAVVPFDAAGIFLVDKEKGRVTVSSQRGFEADDLEGLDDPQSGVIGWVMNKGEGVIMPQVRDDSRYLKGRDSTQSEMAVPIVSAGQVIGSIALESDREDAFSDRDLRIAELIAAQVSSAIVNARLHASLVRQMQVDHELALARDIQQGLMPPEPFAVPGFRVAGPPWRRPPSAATTTTSSVTRRGSGWRSGTWPGTDCPPPC